MCCSSRASIRGTYLIVAVFTKITCPYVYCDKFPVIFKVHLLHGYKEHHQDIVTITVTFTQVTGGSYLIVFHSFDESLDLCWDLPAKEQI